MKTRSFDGATHAEAEQLASDWIKTQPGIRIIDASTTTIGSGDVRRGEKVRVPDRWTITLKYESRSN